MAADDRHPQLDQQLAGKLLAWYRRCARDLPWRRRSDAYAIWIAEVMLQQTRVEQAGPYYQRWLERFPDIAALAAADLDEVLKAWEGLGYYARARNLHAAARRIVEEFGGELPRRVEDLLRLPGVGRYTAGAIASIAFGLDEPVLDGNVTRVLARAYRIRQAPTSVAVRKRLWKLARWLIPPGRASELNQAMMDLGATICLPRRPRCDECPLRRPCLARAAGEQDKLPRKTPRKPSPHYDVAAAVVWNRGKVLIDLRPVDGLLGGLWEFPGGKVQPGETSADAARRELREEVGVEVGPLRPLITVRHAYTHFRITMHVFEGRHRAGRARPLVCQAVRWVHPDELAQYAFPKANQAIIANLRESHSR